MDRIRVNVKFIGGTHTARAAGRVASSTAGWEQAVRALQEKLGIAPSCPAAVVELVSAAHQVWEIDCEAAPGTKAHSMRVLNLALQIADANARSDLELFARRVEIKGGPAYDLSAPQDFPHDGDPDAADENMAIAQRAARYIELRGPDAFDFKFVSGLGENGNLVAFRARSEVPA